MLKKALCLCSLLVSACHADPKSCFGIQVVDEVTGRGVPLVELRTVNEITYYTDSAGWVAFDEPAMMDRPVFFTVTSHGYQYPKDMFGFAGLKLTPKAGETTQIKIARKNIAERLYRTTGGGIYRDSVLLGKPTPIKEPLINAEVLGSDSILSTIYKGKIHWFWGDTNRIAYPLGNFRTTGATSELPAKGGMKPEAGINFDYFKADDGFAKQMVPSELEGPIWLSGLFTLKDEAGAERMVAHYSRMKDLGTRLSRGLVAFDDASQSFKIIQELPLETPITPDGHPTIVTVDGVEYVYFAFPNPNMRIKRDWKSLLDVAGYQAFTPLLAGTQKFDAGKPQLDRAADGKLNWSWKKNTAILSGKEVEELIKSGAIKPEESPLHLVDEAGKPVMLGGGSFYWNEYRKKYVMIGCEVLGSSVLGEIWYAESDKLEGPWGRAVKIVTHDNMDLYNPKQHPFFDEQGGKIIYFEGTYTTGFSGNKCKTPRYDYNQMMYRLDLSDPRLGPAQR